ncbi:MAG: hypothetical protein CMJ89_08930 [Planctomycetes bacterium]|nr:hypothetical protein [Planctomycetota bacterium]
MQQATPHAKLADELPDLPRWVPARGLLLSARCEILIPPESRRGGGHFLLDEGRPLACAIGRPVASVVRSFLDRVEGPYHVLAPQETAEHLRTLLPGWSESPLTVYVHPNPATMALGPHPIRIVTRGDIDLLVNVEPAVRAQVERTLDFAQVCVAFDGERAVAFCSSLYETEAWWDVELHTIESYRRRGYATSAAAGLVRHMVTLGKKPAWGALESSRVASRMAVRHGFRAVDRMVLFAVE